MARLFHRAVQQLILKQEAILTGSVKETDVKYMVYSAHDTQVTAILKWLNPDILYTLDHVFYASSFYIELYSDNDCIKQNLGEQCFTIDLLYNGQKLSVD